MENNDIPLETDLYTTESIIEELKKQNLTYEDLMNSYACEVMKAQEVLFQLAKIIKRLEEDLAQKTEDFESVKYACNLLSSVINDIHTNTRRSLATKGAAERLKSDPKQKAKKDIYENYWMRWQKNPTLYSSKAAFARDMLEKFTCLTNGKSIEKWCTDWTKGTH